MSVMLCTQCDSICMCDDPNKTPSSCDKCGSDKLECDHPSSQFDTALQCFVCSWCGKQLHDDNGIANLRKFALTHPESGLNQIIDTTTH